MDGLPYYKRYQRDALHGMIGMNLEERGAYNTILDMIYDAHGPIPDQERLLSGYLNCDVRVWRRIRKSLLGTGKIYLTDNGKLGNERADKELSLTAHMRQVRRTSAISSGEVVDSQSIAKTEVSKNRNNNNGNSEQMLSKCPAIPEPEPDTESKRDIYPVVSGRQLTLVPTPQIPAKDANQDFELWWKQYPRKIDKGAARKAYERVIKTRKATAEQLMAGALRYAAERQNEDPKYTKHATTWLNAEAWGNESLPAAGGGGRSASRYASPADSVFAGVDSYFKTGEGNE